MLTERNKALVIAKEKGYKILENGNILGLNKKELKSWISNSGYYMFCIKIKGKVVNIPIHRFIGYIKYGKQIFDKKLVIRHLDGNSLNNSWDNLLIGTYSDNMLDIPKEIRIKKANKGAIHVRKFSEEEIKEIRQDRSNGMTLNQLMKKYKTIKSTMYYIITNTTYKN